MEGSLFSRDRLVTLDAIRAARANMPHAIRRTPVVPVARDSAEVGRETLFLKCENLQVTGAFKVRAVFNVMHYLTAEQKSKGVVLASSGNFAQGFAFAGKTLGVPITVVMLDATSPYKIAGTEGYGAEVYLCGTDEREGRRHPAGTRQRGLCLPPGRHAYGHRLLGQHRRRAECAAPGRIPVHAP